jgi:hypothetical protein
MGQRYRRSVQTPNADTMRQTQVIIKIARERQIAG